MVGLDDQTIRPRRLETRFVCIDGSVVDLGLATAARAKFPKGRILNSKPTTEIFSWANYCGYTALRGPWGTLPIPWKKVLVYFFAMKKAISQ
jgi:hypothetical protein